MLDWAPRWALLQRRLSIQSKHSANGPAPFGTVVDDNEATFHGGWSDSTSVPGYEGASYQFHLPDQPPAESVITDNPDGVATGTWPTSTSVAGYSGSNYQYHSPGVGTAEFSWTVDVSVTGDYEVFATWTSHANRASDATYKIHHDDGQGQVMTSIVVVDQRVGGGQRQSLGTFNFLAGQGAVTLGQAETGFVIADEVSITPIGASPNSVSWAFSVTAGGDHRISAKWTSHPNRATNAEYVIEYVDGISGLSENMVAVVDQTSDGGVYNDLATLDVQAGSTVTLTDQANGIVVADAVQVVASAEDVPNQVTWPVSISQDGVYEIYGMWTSHPDRASNATYEIENGSTTAQIQANQQQGGGDWQLLTTLALDASQPVNITLSDVADGYVIADAVQLRGMSGGVSGLNFVHSDHLGTPQVVTGGSQQIVWQGDYEPFGRRHQAYRCPFDFLVSTTTRKLISTTTISETTTLRPVVTSKVTR